MKKEIKIRFAQGQFYKNYLVWNIMFPRIFSKNFTKEIHAKPI